MKSQKIDFIWGKKIPMRDGILLNATIYKHKTEEKVPAIITITPYITDSFHPIAEYFAENDFAFVIVDCRGRGNSEGDFVPNRDEGLDGFDLIEFISEQSWCDGSIAMWGGSYSGFNQWMTIKTNPPTLKTIVPTASSHMAVDFPIYRNMVFPYIIQWLSYTSGKTSNRNLFTDQSFWREKFRELYLNHLPFKDLDKIVGNTSTFFQEWIAHPKPDEYWDTRALTPGHYKKIDIPILSITGHYDADQPGAMNYYKLHEKYGNIEQHYLIIGPWDHPGTRNPKRELGGIEFGENSLLDLNDLHKEWYKWILKKGKKPEFFKKRICYYLMGADIWKFVDKLSDIAYSSAKLYLDSQDGKANDIRNSGFLLEKPADISKPDNYVYDPLDTSPSKLEMEKIEDFLTDQRFDLNLFGNGLVYHSKPFEQDTEISGYIKMIVFIAIDVPDIDFTVIVSEILPDGTKIFLTQDYLRARYKNSLREEKLVIPGEINRYEFSGFTFFARLIKKNSRLRLIIKSPNSIFIQKNYCSGGVVSEESGKDARTASVTLYHDSEHRSYLEIPK